MAIDRRPAFVATLAAAADEERVSRLQREHPDVISHKTSWQVQLDAFEGAGGFLSGEYLWPYPREDNDEFSRRKAMARYHNYLETLVDLYVRFLFTQGVKRDSKNADYNAWQADVDGAGTSLTDFLKLLSAVSLVNGHAGALIDRTADQPAGPTRGEEKAKTVATIFAAGNILDWRFDRNVLAAVKLREDAPAKSLAEDPANAEQFRYLLWDVEGWARYSARGELLDADLPNLGLVPLVVLRPKPSQLSWMLGRALVSNANVVRALFNRASEEDEVLRDQAFSVLTVEVPAEGNVSEVKAALGNTVGAAKALVVKGSIKYETPDQNVPQAIRENMTYLVQEIYRAAHVRFERDSLAAASAESLRLQYTELNEMLQGFAKALSLAERQVARAWFAWRSTADDHGQAEFEAAQVTAQYPDEFFLDALATDLEAWASALAMNLGPTMAKRIKKKAVRRVDPDIPADELAAIDEEIDAMTAEELNPSLVPLGGPPDTGAPGPEAGGPEPPAKQPKPAAKPTPKAGQAEEAA